MLPKGRCWRSLVLKSDFLTLDAANNNIRRVFWNDFIVVEHFEFYSNISNFLRISQVGKLTLCSILTHVAEQSLRTTRMLVEPVRERRPRHPAQCARAVGGKVGWPHELMTDSRAHSFPDGLRLDERASEGVEPWGAAVPRQSSRRLLVS